MKRADPQRVKRADPQRVKRDDPQRVRTRQIQRDDELSTETARCFRKSRSSVWQRDTGEQELAFHRTGRERPGLVAPPTRHYHEETDVKETIEGIVEVLQIQCQEVIRHVTAHTDSRCNPAGDDSYDGV